MINFHYNEKFEQICNKFNKKCPGSITSTITDCTGCLYIFGNEGKTKEQQEECSAFSEEELRLLRISINRLMFSNTEYLESKEITEVEIKETKSDNEKLWKLLTKLRI